MDENALVLECKQKYFRLIMMKSICGRCKVCISSQASYNMCHMCGTVVCDACWEKDAKHCPNCHFSNMSSLCCEEDVDSDNNTWFACDFCKKLGHSPCKIYSLCVCCYPAKIACEDCTDKHTCVITKKTEKTIDLLLKEYKEDDECGEDWYNWFYNVPWYFQPIQYQ